MSGFGSTWNFQLDGPKAARARHRAEEGPSRFIGLRKALGRQLVGNFGKMSYKDC